MVTWSRENGELPEGRSRILLDNTLRMEDTRPEDEGKYICKGHNEGGNVTVAVKILVYGKYFRMKIECILHEIKLGFFQILASPSFIEAPSDVEVNEGGSVKLPCRAQGRPKPRIIWDRIGTLQSFNQHHQLPTKINPYLEKDAQDELSAKAKIMSLRSKRSIHRHKLTAYENEVRTKRETVDDNANEKDDDDKSQSPTGPIPVLVFSTQAPQEVSRLQVTDNGELILLDVTERDQVTDKN